MDPLAALRDIHVPAPPGWFPPAPGWWLAALAALALSALAARRVPAWWRTARARRAALAELSALRRRWRGGEPPQAVAAQVSVLLRRTALSRDRRAEVAGLAGERWLAYLDRTGGGGAFAGGAGRCLADAPYGGSGPVDPGPLLDLAARWVRRNARAADRC